MKYYEPEHAEGYERIRAAGMSAWGQLHGEETFEDSEIRGVLADILPMLHFDSAHPSALEYGCGTGPGACLLAERGMRVCGIDQSAIAIDIARGEAKKRGFSIDYRVGDVCTDAPTDENFDLVVDSFCLQCIVTDADRSRLLSFVRRALKSSGRYVIATAGYSPARDYGQFHFDTPPPASCSMMICHAGGTSPPTRSCANSSLPDSPSTGIGLRLTATSLSLPD